MKDRLLANFMGQRDFNSQDSYMVEELKRNFLAQDGRLNIAYDGLHNVRVEVAFPSKLGRFTSESGSFEDSFTDAMALLLEYTYGRIEL